MKTIKQYIPDLLVILVFAVISLAYFFPADTEGRILYRHDTSAGRGAVQEITDFEKQTGELSRWSNSTFSGMPTYQTAPQYDSKKPLSVVTEAYHLWLPENVWYVFAYLLGFFILLRAFDFKWYLAALGSVIWAFSSYFLIIIAAGHIWKVMALAYLPPMIAGIVLCYRKRYALGFVVTALFTAMEVMANHVQMTYYYLFIVFFMVIAYFIDALKKKELPHFLKASLVCLAAGVLGILMNISNLYHTWEYQKESMRGKSELVTKDTANQTSSGLDRDYITHWSYGIDETWTLLVPNAKGGSSMNRMSESQTAMQYADNEFIGLYQQMGQYWGEQPGTSGPVYVGAFVCFLFILGLFVVKGPMKWALLAATILSVLLSWGRNFMWFTDLFIDYMPMYAKFRTVASILVIAEFTMPLLGMMALKRVLEEPECLRKRHALGISFLLTAGVCALMAVQPYLFFDGFVSLAEQDAISEIPQEYIAPLMANLTAMREAVLSADCWRSFWIIAIGAATLLAFYFKKLSGMMVAAVLILLCLFDLWQVDKRYLNDAMFVNADVRDKAHPLTETDKEILADKTLDYRVLNFARNTFNENETSFHHKSVGGYHAAKLRRYQELIDKYLDAEINASMKAIAGAWGDMTKVSPNVSPVFNMLNTRYFILPMQSGKTAPLLNPYAFGNAWYVDEVKYVDNANQELDGMAKINLRHQAIADRKFADVLGEQKSATDSLATVTMKKYAPNNLEYETSSAKEGVVVFSEIYYPGWTATIDGKEAELGRVNYVLRALRVPAGKHKIVLDFHPQSVKTTETIAYIATAILALAVVLLIVRRKLKK